MKRFVGTFFAFLCLSLAVSATGQGASLKQVYLKDGGIIECTSFFKNDGKVVVVVNRDVVLDFASSEINMKRTFAVQKAGVRARKAVAAVGKRGATAATPTVAQGAGKPDAITATATPPPSKVTVAKADVVAGKASATPAAGVASNASPAPAAAQPAAISNAGAPAAKPTAAPASGTPAQPAAKPAVAPAPGVQPQPAVPAPTAATPPVRKPLPLAPAKPAEPLSGFQAGALGMTAVAPFLLILLIIFLLIIFASLWKVFTKAGEAGWASLVPVYNLYILVKIAGKPWWWVALMFVPPVGLIMFVLVSVEVAKKFNQGLPFGLGLAFLGIIFFPILAFGPAKYGQKQPLRHQAVHPEPDDTFQFE